MRVLAVLLAVCAPSAGMAQALECLSIDGQVRIDFQQAEVAGVTLRVPAAGAREARTLRLSASDVTLEVLSESPPKIRRTGCADAASGTIAIVGTTTTTVRRIRLGFPDGGAFPPSVVGRSADGDLIERDLTCTRRDSVMAACP